MTTHARSTRDAAAAPAPDVRNQGQDDPAAWDRLAAGFDAYVTPSGIDIGAAPLAAMGLGPGQRFLDVAAGSGALSLAAARRGAEVTAVDFSPAMIERLDARAAAAGLRRLHGEVMDGTDLQLEDDSFDAAGSQFGVMLFPDYARGLRELVRVTKPDGQVLLITMGPPSRVEFLTFFQAALGSAVSGFTGLPSDPPPLPLRLADPARVREALEEAGLREVDVQSRSHAVEHPSAEHLWDWVVHSNPLGAGMVAGLTPRQKEDALEALAGRLRERARGDGPALLHNAINVGIGRV